MKKVFITFSLLVLTFLISGCGCSKKNNEKKIVCNSETSEGTANVELYFRDGYLIKQHSKLVTEFSNAELAQSYYNDLIAYGETLTLDGNTVYSTSTYSYDSSDENYLEQNVREKYINEGFNCE